jgi:hypothetical protein
MLFVRSPHDIYYDIFSLIKLGFSAEYIETISPAERGLYKSYNEMEKNNKNTEDNAKAANLVGLDIEDL